MIDKENCHILIIREKLHALLSERILKDSGYTNVYTASSSKHALSIIEKITPDLIFLDYRQAKDEPTGIELFNQLKRFPALKNTAFLIYVARLPQDLYEEIKELGFAGLILMPMGYDELVQACEALLSGGTYFRDFNEYW
ncbi:MAG: response regulator [Ardenticatenaceae bacterium]|nr:response regulator [Ardenticatenaceae bacterium]